MGERFPGDGAAANDFGRRWLHEWEARLLLQANYPCPSDMRVPGSWRLSAGGVPMPPPPAGEFVAEVEAIRNAMPALARDEPKFATNNHAMWTAYFVRRHADALASVNDGPASSGRQNSNGRRLWWGVPGRTLHAVLAHIECGKEPPLEYPAPTLSRACRREQPPLGGQSSHAGGSTPSWATVPRRMETATSSSSGSGSRSSSAARSPLLVPVKPELQTSLGRRTHAGGLVINKGRSAPVPSPPRRSFLSRLVKPKKEKELSPTVEEHEAMAADLEAGLAWAKDDYVREEMERQRQALEEHEGRHHLEMAQRRQQRREQGGIVILDDSEDEDPAPLRPRRRRRRTLPSTGGTGCSSSAAPKDEPPSDDDGGDYTTEIYRMLGMS